MEKNSYVADAPGTMSHKDDMIAKITHRGYATDNLQRNYALGELTTLADKHRSSSADLLNCLIGQETSNILDFIYNNILRERCNKDFMKNLPQLWSDDDINKAVLTKKYFNKKIKLLNADGKRKLNELLDNDKKIFGKLIEYIRANISHQDVINKIYNHHI